LAIAPGKAQSPPGQRLNSAEQIVAQVPPTAAFTVQRHSIGADVVELTFLNAEFPHQLIRQIAERVGAETGTPIRGLQIYRTPGSGTDIRFLKASFATNGLLDPASGIVRLQPLARAVAGIQAPVTIRGISVGVSNFRPSARTLRTYVGTAVAVAGTITANPLGLEYRIALLNQDPSVILVPDEFLPERSAALKPSTARSPAWLVPILLGVAAIATGFLVYFVTLTFGRPAPRRVDR